MIFTDRAIEWDGEDRKQLLGFLEGPIGQKVLQHLLSMEPGAYDGPNGNQIISASKKIEGYRLALDQLVGLTKEQPQLPERPDQYPNLDDDSQWADAPKPTEQKK